MAVPKSLELWRFTPCDSALRCEQEWLRFYIHTLQHCLTNRGVILHNSRLPGRWLATSLIIISGMDRKLLYCCCLASCTLHSFWLLRHSIFTCMYAEIYDHPRKICASTQPTSRADQVLFLEAEPLLMMLLKRKSESTSGSWIHTGCPGYSVSSCECK